MHGINMAIAVELRNGKIVHGRLAQPAPNGLYVDKGDGGRVIQMSNIENITAAEDGSGKGSLDFELF